MSKSILKASSINVVLKFLSLGLIFLFQSLLSKYISVEEYSLFSKFIVYSNYLLLLFSFGLTASLIYFPKNDKEFIQNFIYILGLYSIFGLFLLFMVMLFSINEYIYIVMFSTLLSLISVALAYYQFTKKFVSYAVGGLIQAVFVFLILPLMYSFTITSIENIIQLYIGVNFIYLLGLLVHIYINNEIFYNRILEIRKYFSYGFKIVFVMILSQFIYITDYILIDYYLAEKYLAYYFVAMMISKMIFVLADTSGTIFFPLYTKANQNQQSETKEIDNSLYFISSLIFMMSLLLLIIFILFGKYFIEILYQKEYLQAYVPTLLLISGTQGMIMYKLISRKLSAKNIWKTLYLSIAFAAIVNVGLNIYLIPKYGINGAAFSSMVSYWICGIMIVILSKEKLSNYLIYMFLKSPK